MKYSMNFYALPFTKQYQPAHNRQMEMEGMESEADPVKAEGEAAKILGWMQQHCPEMVPMAPLLQELMFVGFSETR